MLLYQNPDQVYKDMIRYAKTGFLQDNHTGVPAYTQFGFSYKLPVSTELFPILTIKEIKPSVFTELVWYITGQKDIKTFGKYSKIWEQWATPEGELESAYGRYWRFYPVQDSVSFYTKGHSEKVYLSDGEVFVGPGHSCWTGDHNGRPALDQLKYLVESLKSDTRSRRLIMQAYYPPNAVVSKLPACHHTITLVTENTPLGKRLNLLLDQRSCDVGLGFGFNQVAYCALLLLLCKECGYSPGYFGHCIADLHIYKDHLEPLQSLLTKKSYQLPGITLPDKSIFDLVLTEDQNDGELFTLNGYEHEEFLKLKCHT